MTTDHLQRDFVGYAAHPPQAHWPGEARLAVNFCINFEEGSEPSVPDGDENSEISLTEGGSSSHPGRDLAAESMFEFGSRVGFWRLHRLFAERALPATIYACALALERNAPAAEAIRAYEGYDVCAHGWRWEYHQKLTETQERERIARAVSSLERTTGKRPAGWYCRYGPGLNTRRLVVEHGGFLYDGDAYNDELPYWTRVSGRHHLVIPHTLVNNDTKYMRGAMLTGRDFYDYMKETFDVLYREGSRTPGLMTVSLHQRVIGQAGRSSGLARFLDYVSRFSGVWICRRDQIARHWHEHHAPD